MTRIRVAVVGLGYWGPNLVRNFQAADDYQVVALVDSNPKRRDRIGASYPWARGFASLDAALAETRPELVAIATPVATHFSLALQALQAGCHVLCEKPLAISVRDAEELVSAAAREKRRLFVDHTFTYTGAVRLIREQYRARLLGDLFYVDSVRINLGLFQQDSDVVWDLAPHDLSILGYVLGQKVKSLQVNGSSHNPRALADVAHLTLEYESGVHAHMHLSWLSPVKLRRMIFAGTKQSIIYDDLEAAEKVKIYDAGVDFDVSDVERRKQVLVNYRRGEMRAPALDNKEALAVEVQEIARALRGEDLRLAEGPDGLEVVRVLDACKRSMAAQGARVRL